MSKYFIFLRGEMMKYLRSLALIILVLQSTAFTANSSIIALDPLATERNVFQPRLTQFLVLSTVYEMGRCLYSSEAIWKTARKMFPFLGFVQESSVDENRDILMISTEAVLDLSEEDKNKNKNKKKALLEEAQKAKAKKIKEKYFVQERKGLGKRNKYISELHVPELHRLDSVDGVKIIGETETKNVSAGIITTEDALPSRSSVFPVLSIMLPQNMGGSEAGETSPVGYGLYVDLSPTQSFRKVIEVY